MRRVFNVVFVASRSGTFWVSGACVRASGRVTGIFSYTFIDFSAERGNVMYRKNNIFSTL